MSSLPLRVYDGEKWVNIGVQSGQVLYQNEEPSSPQTGSIWIDSDSETAVLNDQDFLTINSASAIYAPSASPTFSGQVNLPATTNYDGNLLSATLGSKLDYPSGGADGNVLTKSGTAAAWSAPEAAGLTLITADSFTAVSSVSINNCFSATHKTYQIVIEGTSTGARIDLRLRASGTDASGANYDVQNVSVANTTFAGARNTDQTSFFQGGGLIEDDMGLAVITISNAAVATKTSLVSHMTDSPSVAYRATGGVHQLTNAYDGITFLFSATSSGTIRIYGYKD
jgi:hypothetical protein